MEIRKFNDFKFEVIDVTFRGGLPEMHITKSYVIFNKRLIEDMGYPQFVKPMVDAKSKAFGLKACKADDEYAMRFSKPKGEQKKSISYSGSVIRHMLRKIMGKQWQDNNRYHMVGVWYPDEKAMVFDLTTSKELPPFKFREKGQVPN